MEFHLVQNRKEMEIYFSLCIHRLSDRDQRPTDFRSLGGPSIGFLMMQIDATRQSLEHARQHCIISKRFQDPDHKLRSAVTSSKMYLNHFFFYMKRFFFRRLYPIHRLGPYRIFTLLLSLSIPVVLNSWAADRYRSVAQSVPGPTGIN